MRYSVLAYGFMAALGIVFIVYFPNSMFPWGSFLGLGTDFVYASRGGYLSVSTPTWMLLTCFCQIVGNVFLIAGLCGISSKYFKSTQSLSALQARIAGDSGRNSRIFKFIAVAGAAFLGTLPTMGFLNNYSIELSTFFMSIYNLYVVLLFSCLYGGTWLLTVGVCGIVRRQFRNYQNFYTILIAILIPSLILMPLTWWLSSVTVTF